LLKDRHARVYLAGIQEADWVIPVTRALALHQTHAGMTAILKFVMPAQANDPSRAAV
jgi:hypothetical protein